MIRQVYAIWHTLQRRGMRYSDISRSSAESPVVMSQHVRLFDEALAARQGQLRRGHGGVRRRAPEDRHSSRTSRSSRDDTFLVFDLDESGDDMLGLETTLMGSTKAAPGGTRRRRPRVPSALTERFRGQPSFSSFAAAIEEGTAQLEKNMRGFEGDDPDYPADLPAAEAREIGILPWPVSKGRGHAASVTGVIRRRFCDDAVTDDWAGWAPRTAMT